MLPWWITDPDASPEGGPGLRADDETYPLPALLERVLPWAQANQPDGYAKTAALALMAVPGAHLAEHERMVRRYLARLTDLRCEADPSYRRTAALGVLAESSQVITLRERTGQQRTLTFTGRYAPRPHPYTFPMLALERASFTALLDAIEVLDLDAVDDGPKAGRPSGMRA